MGVFFYFGNQRICWQLYTHSKGLKSKRVVTHEFQQPVT